MARPAIPAPKRPQPQSKPHEEPKLPQTREMPEAGSTARAGLHGTKQ